MLPSRMEGSKGGVSHSSNGSGGWTIKKEGGLARRVDPIRVDDRMCTGFRRIDQLRVFESFALKPGADKLGGSADLRAKGRVGTNAGDPKETKEVFHFPYNGIFI